MGLITLWKSHQGNWLFKNYLRVTDNIGWQLPEKVLGEKWNLENEKWNLGNKIKFVLESFTDTMKPTFIFATSWGKRDRSRCISKQEDFNRDGPSIALEMQRILSLWLEQTKSKPAFFEPSPRGLQGRLHTHWMVE